MIEALTSRESQKPYLSALRAAKDYGQRPTAMILHDPYAGNRKWWSDWLYRERWVPDGSSKDWTFWDFILADAFQVIEDFTDKESGQLIWYDQSGDVFWDVKKSTSGYLEAVEKAQGDDKDPKPGVRLYAVPTFRDPNDKPTLSSWLKDVSEEKADRRPAHVRDARPPTRAELKALREAKNTPVE